MNYYLNFLKALGISSVIAGVPALFFTTPINTAFQTIYIANNGRDKGWGSGYIDKISDASQPIPTISTVNKAPTVEEDKQLSEHCSSDTQDERSNSKYCEQLKRTIHRLEEVEKGFKDRVYLSLSNNRKVLLKNILKENSTEAKEAFDFYLKQDLNASLWNNYIQSLEFFLTLHFTTGKSKYIWEKLWETKKYFPNEDISVGDFENWRYIIIMKRLAELKKDVILKPIKLYHYFAYFKIPGTLALMVEEAQYFYFTGGSKWAGGKDGWYILNFTEALNTYLPLPSK